MNIKILFGGRGHIICVRVKGSGNRVKITVIVLLPGDLKEPMQIIMGSLANLSHALVPDLPVHDLYRIGQLWFTFFFQLLIFFLNFTQVAVKDLEFQGTAPAIFQLGLVGGRIQFFGISFQIILAIRVKPGVHDLIHQPLDFFDSIIKNAHPGIGQDDPASTDLVINMICKGAKLVHIGLEEKTLPRVQLAQVKIIGRPGQLIVQSFVTKMLGWQLVPQHIGDKTVATGIKFHRHDLALSNSGQEQGKAQPTNNETSYTHLQTPKKTG